MARAIWSGVLTFGLVSVPVELYSATETHGPVFHQFEKGTAEDRSAAGRPETGHSRR
jgi:DNA end-binding protein Ku